MKASEQYFPVVLFIIISSSTGFQFFNFESFLD